jgi:PAS domain S-box-containing protein
MLWRSCKRNGISGLRGRYRVTGVGGLELVTDGTGAAARADLKPSSPSWETGVYRTIFRTAAVGLARVGPDGTFIEVNDRVCEITGYPREEMEGLRFQAITHPDDLEEDLGNAGDLLSGRSQTYAMDKRYIRKDGSIVWVRLAGSLIRDEAGEPDFFVAVVEDITDRKEAEFALEESERQLRRVLDQLFAFVGLLSTDGVLLHANAAPLKAAGIELADVVGKPFEDAYWWSYDAAIQARLRESITLAATGKIVRYDVAVRMAEGRLMFIDFQLSPMRDDDGRVIGLIPSAIDIDERKSAEQHNQMLLAELNHRVRNSLAIVQHFARHAFRTVDHAKDAMHVFEQRLMALAEAHSLLTTAQWEPVSLEALIVRTVTAACGSADRFVLSGPLVVLPPRTAVTMSLALHEMCTNAVKYGALSVPGGTVRVTWEVLAVDGPQFSLTWREEGGPEVSPPDQPGFGTRMIRQALAHEFQGGVELEFLGSGLVCTLTGKLPAPLEARA